MVSSKSPIHPFPARMAPELALAALQRLPPDSLVLDPMCGSGTVLRTAAELGLPSIGIDIDPLSVLMATVWASTVDSQEVLDCAERAVAMARSLDADKLYLPWIDDDAETTEFVDFWFDEPQRNDLRCLTFALQEVDVRAVDILKLSLSRLIIKKDNGASLARDVSHSRPHRVRVSNDYDVLGSFVSSVQRVRRILDSRSVVKPAGVSLGDARRLEAIPDCAVRQIVTSPPYLNAIDYLRGHRLALVWLGYTLAQLRGIRRQSVGAEVGLARGLVTSVSAIASGTPGFAELPARTSRIYERYVADLSCILSESSRVLQPGGEAVFVVGDSTIRGVFVQNSKAVELLANLYGLSTVDRYDRQLPENRRYLPPPQVAGGTSINRRMRSEVVLKFKK
jgi:SAM-dependent methyltransferase